VALPADLDSDEAQRHLPRRHRHFEDGRPDLRRSAEVLSRMAVGSLAGMDHLSGLLKYRDALWTPLRISHGAGLTEENTLIICANYHETIPLMLISLALNISKE